jgi:hypothetical protein
MTDDITNKRREKLKDTIRKAAKELLGFGNIPIAGFSFPLDDSKTTWIIVRPATEEEADAELTKGHR